MTLFRKYYGAADAAASTGMTAALSANPWIAAASAIPSIINMFRGAHMIKEGKAEQAANVRPVLKQSGQYEDLLQFFEKQAMYGLDPSSMAWQLEQSNQGLTRSLSSMLQAGGDPNLVSGQYAQYADSLAKATLTDATARWQKVNMVAQAATELIKSKQTEFLYNEDAPYKDKAQEAAAKMQAGFQTQSNALDTITASMMNAMSKNYKKDADPVTTPDAAVAEPTPTFTPVGGKEFTPTGDLTNPYLWQNFNTWHPTRYGFGG